MNYHDDVTRGLFARELLRELSAPKTQKNMVALLAWMAGENTKARNNPLATTRPYPRATNYNSVGVKHYATLRDGITATVETLNKPFYDKIRAALRRGTSVHAVERAIVASLWGTEHVPWRPVNADVEAYAKIVIRS